jgi:hypothetical protein
VTGQRATTSCIDLAQPAAWHAALDGIDHGIAHTWEWCSALQLSHRSPPFLYVCETSDGRVVCPLAERSFRGVPDVVTPYGFGGFAGPGLTPAFVPHWEQFVLDREYVCGYVGLHPLLVRGDGPFADTEREATLYALDLDLSDERLFDRLSNNRKRQLRSGGPDQVRIDDAEATQFFIDELPGLMRRRQARIASSLDSTMLSKLAAHSGTVLVSAHVGGAVAAVAAIGVEGRVGEYVFGVSTQRNGFMTHVIWASIALLRERGAHWLLLGGGAHEDDGIAQFKERFGPEHLEYRCLKQVYRPTTYEELCRATGVIPMSPGFFPAYHRRSGNDQEGQ